MKRLINIKREIFNWFYLKRVMSKERELSMKNPDSLWIKHNLRMNWYGRIYTVISLRDQDMGEEELVRNWKAMEIMKPISEYLQSLGLQEIIFPSIEQIPNSQSYLIVYSPVFNEFTYGWIFRKIVTISILSAIIYFAIKFI